MKNFFKPEDFQALFNRDFCAQIANEKLNKLIESWPEVYGTEHPNDFGYTDWSQQRHEDVEFKARLAFIEEIDKEPCKHEPYPSFYVNDKVNCKYCGAELMAEWKEKK